MPSAKEFLARLPKAATAEHRATIEQAFHIAANFALERGKIESNKSLSPQGQREAAGSLGQEISRPAISATRAGRAAL
jgi:hypothetical protein